MADTIKTRIQLKNDTEANWRRAVLASDNPEGVKTTGNSFKPKEGEVIIFSSDETHPFSRLKIGDGKTDALSLPFIDSGTVNGQVITDTVFISEKFADFPVTGEEKKIYITTDQNNIYYWANNAYNLLTGFEFNKSEVDVSFVSSWKAGSVTTVSKNDSEAILNITVGTAPTLTKETKSVLSSGTSLTKSNKELDKLSVGSLSDSEITAAWG